MKELKVREEAYQKDFFSIILCAEIKQSRKGEDLHHKICGRHPPV
jgi:hypothetical protein